MLESLGAIDWLMIVCAFALGFGVIKFMIVARNERGAQPPRAETRADDARPPPGDEA